MATSRPRCSSHTYTHTHTHTFHLLDSLVHWDKTHTVRDAKVCAAHNTQLGIAQCPAGALSTQAEA